MDFNKDVFDNYSELEKEIYDNIKISSSDDAYLGCYIRGHYDMKVFEKVSLDWVKYGYEIDINKANGFEIRQGYFKETPYCYDGEYRYNILVYKENKVRGSYAITELVFNDEI